MTWLWLIPVIVLAVGLAIFLLRHRVRRFGSQVQVERAAELFRLQRERLEAKFLQAAGATGKPRGLRWKGCEWHEAIEYVRDRQNGQIAALLGVTIHFEAIEGGDMEGIAAVSLPRNASAVFFFHQGHWDTVGRAVFNMNPNEAIEHFKNQYERA